MITYNHEKFIREAIDGVLSQQTNFGFELIIANDCSPDKTDEIVNEYINIHPKGNCIKYFSHKKNLGMIPNFIFAMEKCKGRYIALCEGDDYWTVPLKLQKQVDFLEANDDCNICFHSVYELNNDGKKEKSLLNTSLKEETYTIEDLAKGNLIHTPSVVFRNLFGGKLPSWFFESPAGDYPLYMLCAKNGSIKYLPEPMAVYRKHDGGIWSNMRRRDMLVKWIKVLDFLLQEQFNDIAISNLKKQKIQCINEMLELSVNVNWQQFKLDINDYALDDAEIIKNWLVDKLPDLVNKYSNSTSYKIGSKIVRVLKYIKFW